MIKRKTGRLRAKGSRLRPKGIKRRKGAFQASGRVSGGVPTWLKCVPEGKHGSGTLGKRLWRLKSDFVRIRDWTAFGACIATGVPIKHWNDGQAGHFKNWNKCNGMFKYHEMNIHLQTAQSNSWPDKDTWKEYENNLVKRYNQEFVDAIETSNANWPQKVNNQLVLKEIERTIKMLGMMEEKPPYWNRLMKLRAESSLQPPTTKEI